MGNFFWVAHMCFWFLLIGAPRIFRKGGSISERWTVFDWRTGTCIYCKHIQLSWSIYFDPFFPADQMVVIKNIHAHDRICGQVMWYLLVALLGEILFVGLVRWYLDISSNHWMCLPQTSGWSGLMYIPTVVHTINLVYVYILPLIFTWRVDVTLVPV